MLVVLKVAKSLETETEKQPVPGKSSPGPNGGTVGFTAPQQHSSFRTLRRAMAFSLSQIPQRRCFWVFVGFFLLLPALVPTWV
jgi:hypothetical protein